MRRNNGNCFIFSNKYNFKIIFAEFFIRSFATRIAGNNEIRRGDSFIY